MKQFVLAALAVQLAAFSFGGTIIAENSDFEVFSTGPGGSNLGDFGVGDTGGGSPNLGRRAVVQFSLTGLSGSTVQSATLNLFLIESRLDQFPDPGTITSSAPFINPGLGDTVVLHVADYGTPDLADYNAASIGNDPGILIAAAVQPSGASMSINIAAALQQAITAGFSFVTFRIQTATETDNDGLNDIWFFASADNATASHRPFLSYEVTTSNGGATTPEPSTFLLAAGAAAALLTRRYLGKQR
ncbi:MAG: hypothetical protein ABIR70_04030 [Bryobacteraceae bacterium]